MLAGTLLVGASGYVFFAVIGHGRFDAQVAAALSATYLLSNILGPGVFIAAEQESSRVISRQRVGGGVAHGTARRLGLVCAGLGVLTVMVLALCAPALLVAVLDGTVGLILALVLAVVGSAAVYYIRGLTGGQQRFRHYAATTGIDGGFRIAGCLALAAAGATNPTAYALALCAGPAAAALCTARGALPTSPPAPAVIDKAGTSDGAVAGVPRLGELSKGVAYLLVASFASLAMANLAPVIVTGLPGSEPATAAVFAAAVVLTRVPLLLMGPIQALLLPRLTSAAAAGRLTDFRRDTIRGLSVIGILTVIAIGGTALLGQWALRVLIGGSGGSIGSGVLVLLTLSAMVQMAVQFLQPALVAIGRHRMLVVGWLSGAAAFAVAFAVPISPIDRGVLAQLVGPLVTMMIELGTLSVSVGRRRVVPRRVPGSHGTHSPAG